MDEDEATNESEEEDILDLNIEPESDDDTSMEQISTSPANQAVENRAEMTARAAALAVATSFLPKPRIGGIKARLGPRAQEMDLPERNQQREASAPAVNSRFRESNRGVNRHAGTSWQERRPQGENQASSALAQTGPRMGNVGGHQGNRGKVFRNDNWIPPRKQRATPNTVYVRPQPSGQMQQSPWLPGHEPGMQLGHETGLPFGQDPGIPFGQDPGISFGQEPGIPFGQDPGIQFGLEPGLQFAQTQVTLPLLQPGSLLGTNRLVQQQPRMLHGIELDRLRKTATRGQSLLEEPTQMRRVSGSGTKLQISLSEIGTDALEAHSSGANVGACKYTDNMKAVALLQMFPGCTVEQARIKMHTFPPDIQIRLMENAIAKAQSNRSERTATFVGLPPPNLNQQPGSQSLGCSIQQSSLPRLQQDLLNRNSTSLGGPNLDQRRLNTNAGYEERRVTYGSAAPSRSGPNYWPSDRALNVGRAAQHNQQPGSRANAADGWTYSSKNLDNRRRSFGPQHNQRKTFRKTYVPRTETHDAQTLENQDVDTHEQESQDLDAHDNEPHDQEAQELEDQDFDPQELETHDLESHDLDTEALETQVFEQPREQNVDSTSNVNCNAPATASVDSKPLAGQAATSITTNSVGTPPPKTPATPTLDAIRQSVPPVSNPQYSAQPQPVAVQLAAPTVLQQSEVIKLEPKSPAGSPHQPTTRDCVAVAGPSVVRHNDNERTDNRKTDCSCTDCRHPGKYRRAPSPPDMPHRHSRRHHSRSRSPSRYSDSSSSDGSSHYYQHKRHGEQHLKYHALRDEELFRIERERRHECRRQHALRWEKSNGSNTDYIPYYNKSISTATHRGYRCDRYGSHRPDYYSRGRDYSHDYHHRADYRSPDRQRSERYRDHRENANRRYAAPAHHHSGSAGTSTSTREPAGVLRETSITTESRQASSSSSQETDAERQVAALLEEKRLIEIKLQLYNQAANKKKQ